MDLLGNAFPGMRDLFGTLVQEGKGLRDCEVRGKVGFGIAKFGFGIANFGMVSIVAHNEIRNPQSAIRNSKFEIRNPKFDSIRFDYL